MKKQIAILIMAILIVAPLIQDVSATKTVFLTSDNIIDHDTDLKLLNSLKNYIEEISGGELQVILDNQAPSPGEGWRSISVTSDVSINLAAADAGNFLQLATSTVGTNKQIILINIGDYDLDNNSNYLRRAWDDNYSNESLAGIRDPGTFLKNAGIYYLQPVKEFPNNAHDGILSNYDEEMNRKLAEEIVNIVNTHGNDTKVLSDSLIVTNNLSPKGMANASKMLVNSHDKDMKGPYGSYSAPQLLYQTSAYLNGDGIDIPKEYSEPENPMGISFLVRDSYSIYDYMKMAGIVKNYMDENGRAPNYIEYDGAKISYYDLLYNFAKITENHTDNHHMDFAKQYHFEKVNESILLNSLPYVFAIIILILACLGLRKIRRK